MRTEHAAFGITAPGRLELEERLLLATDVRGNSVSQIFGFTDPATGREFRVVVTDYPVNVEGATSLELTGPGGVDAQSEPLPFLVSGRPASVLTLQRDDNEVEMTAVRFGTVVYMLAVTTPEGADKSDDPGHRFFASFKANEHSWRRLEAQPPGISVEIPRDASYEPRSSEDMLVRLFTVDDRHLCRVIDHRVDDAEGAIDQIQQAMVGAIGTLTGHTPVEVDGVSGRELRVTGNDGNEYLLRLFVRAPFVHVASTALVGEDENLDGQRCVRSLTLIAPAPQPSTTP